MKIRVCDICGDVLEDYKSLDKRYKVKIKMIYVSGGFLKNKKYDLCKVCMNKIMYEIREATDETEGET